jgi:hypothetical protein
VKKIPTVDNGFVIIAGGMLLLYYTFLKGKRVSYVAKAKRSGSTGAKLTNHGGRVLRSPKVKLILWGTVPAGAQTDQKLRALMSTSSNYYNVLSEYGGGKPAYLGYVHSTSAIPSVINDAALAKLIGSLITTGQVPDFRTGQEMIYVVMAPPGSRNADKTGDAYNTDFSWGGSDQGVMAVYYGKQDIASITRALAEEIAEAVTDPGPKPAWQAGSDSLIGDPCSSPFLVNGVTVEGLWSNAKNACTTAAG